MSLTRTGSVPKSSPARTMSRPPSFQNCHDGVDLAMAAKVSGSVCAAQPVTMTFAFGFWRRSLRMSCFALRTASTSQRRCSRSPHSRYLRPRPARAWPRSARSRTAVGKDRRAHSASRNSAVSTPSKTCAVLPAIQTPSSRQPTHSVPPSRSISRPPCQNPPRRSHGRCAGR